MVFHFATNRDSIGLRLVVGAAIWIVAALLITVWLLTSIFRDHVERSFESDLRDHVLELLKLAELDPQDHVTFPRLPLDPRTNSPFSGWYWVISGPGQRPFRSRSLWDETLPLPDPPLVHGETRIYLLEGPQKQKLRAMAKVFTLPKAPSKEFVILMAGPQFQIDKAVKRFVSLIALTLGVLGLGLFGAVVIQVLYGLKPLRHVQEALADIAAGREARLQGNFPSEVRPLVDELNSLLDHNAKVLERARTHVGNLAHALKTPVAVLRNEAALAKGKLGATMRHQTDEMDRHVNHHLRRARMAGASGILGVRTEVAEVAEHLIRAMGRLFNDRPRKGTLAGSRGLCFHGERQDLEELLGNLVENAFKWSRSQVRVTIGKGHNPDLPIKNRIIISVEDDGPGIPADKRGEALGRGKRLDETVPGTGLGLSIVRDLAEMYEGSLSLDESEFGGLKATLDLPAAAADKTKKEG